MLGSKTDAQNSWLKIVISKPAKSLFIKSLVGVSLSSGFLLSSCVMTKAQGEQLTFQVRNLEDEVAKLQRVRHDLQVLLEGKVGDLFDRIAKLEGQLVSLRESHYEGSNQNGQLVAEIQNLRDELEQTKHHYKNLETDQKSLAQNQMALKVEQEKIKIPPFKDDHFALAKKFYLSGKFESAIFLLDKFMADYPDDGDLLGQSHYLLGEIYRKMGDEEKNEELVEVQRKKSVVNYQAVVEKFKSTKLREESLYKIGLVLKAMGNVSGAEAAFSELLQQNKKSERAGEAKKHLAELKSKK